MKSSEAKRRVHYALEVSVTTYIKTITFRPTGGGLKVSPDKVDPIGNDALEKIQRGGGKDSRC